MAAMRWTQTAYVTMLNVMRKKVTTCGTCGSGARCCLPQRGCVRAYVEEGGLVVLACSAGAYAAFQPSFLCCKPQVLLVLCLLRSELFSPRCRPPPPLSG
jgi:hypothetical protein